MRESIRKAETTPARGAAVADNPVEQRVFARHGNEKTNAVAQQSAARHGMEKTNAVAQQTAARHGVKKTKTVGQRVYARHGKKMISIDQRLRARADGAATTEFRGRKNANPHIFRQNVLNPHIFATPIF